MDALMRTCARIGDLGYLLDKDDYLELFRRFFFALVARLTSAMSSRSRAILPAMGVRERFEH